MCGILHKHIHYQAAAVVSLFCDAPVKYKIVYINFATPIKLTIFITLAEDNRYYVAVNSGEHRL